MIKELIFNTIMNKVGNKDNPSYVIPVSKKDLVINDIDPNKKIKVVVTQ